MKIKNPYIAGLIPWIGICIIGIIGTEYLITRLLKETEPVMALSFYPSLEIQYAGDGKTWYFDI